MDSAVVKALVLHLERGAGYDTLVRGSLRYIKTLCRGSHRLLTHDTSPIRRASFPRTSAILELSDGAIETRLNFKPPQYGHGQADRATESGTSGEPAEATSG